MDGYGLMETIPGQDKHDLKTAPSQVLEDMHSRVLNGKALLEIGVIIRVIPTTYSITCLVNGHEIRCAFANDLYCHIMGVKSCDLPTEGSYAIIYIADDDPSTGYVISTLPPVYNNPQKNPSDAKHRTMSEVFTEPGFNYYGAQAWKSIADDPDSDSHGFHHDSRMENILPGEWVKANPLGTMVGLFHFMATIRAGSLASIDLSMLDDMVKISSMRYVNTTAAGELDVFNDGGIAIGELRLAGYEAELLGLTQQKIINEKDGTGQSATQQLYKPKDGGPIKERLKAYYGGLADMLQIYLTYVDDSKIAAFRAALTGDGSFSLDSAQDITLRCGPGVPSPVRKKEADDGSGTKASDQFKNGQWVSGHKTPFEYDDAYPGGRALEDFDADAWKEKQMYQRFDDFKDDFDTPEAVDAQLEKTIKPYDSAFNLADTTKSGGAGLKIGKDGSIRIWDKYGSEINLRNGEIVLSAPGDIILAPGKNLINLPGRDYILKCRGDLDFTAEDGAMKLAAKESLYLYSKEQGILLHTDSDGEPYFLDQSDMGFKGAGYDMPKGIVMKADKSPIASLGENIVLKTKKDLKIEAKDNVIAHTGQWALYCDSFYAMAKEGKSVLMLTDSGVYQAGKSIIQLAGEDWTVTKGKKVLALPSYYWAGGANAKNYYKKITSKTKGMWEEFSNKDDWLGAFKKEFADNITFRFRSDIAYAGSGNPDGSYGLVLYQNRWQLLKDKGYSLLENYETESWGDDTNFSVDDTYPWPGNSSSSIISYVEYDPLDSNFNFKTGLPEKRDGIVGSGGTFTKVAGMKNMLVAKR